MSAPDKRDAATRAMDKLIEQKILEPFQRYNMGQVIRQEYEPLIKAARDTLVEMSWALHNKCVDAPGLFEQRRTELRKALAHIEGDATP